MSPVILAASCALVLEVRAVGEVESCVCDLILLFSLLLVTFLYSLLLEGALLLFKNTGMVPQGCI